VNSFNPIEQRLLNEFQHDFPLVSQPYLAIGEQLGVGENEVIDRLGELSRQGAVSRVGPVFSPGCIGASTLAALAVPEERLEALAHWLNAMPEINHNYQREHRYNLWFVAAAPDEAWLDVIVQKIAAESRCPMLVLPLVERYHIDLGFDLRDGHRCHGRGVSDSLMRVRLDASQRAIVGALQGGLGLARRPFDQIAGLNEEAVIRQVAQWREQGVIKRFGVVVRHHEVGYRENAMVVWDVPDERVSELGRLASNQEGVTLCYRRPRQLPDWPYNLFCMVHGTDRVKVRFQIAQLARHAGLEGYGSQVLFSCRRFKQCGARYVGDGHGRH